MKNHFIRHHLNFGLLALQAIFVGALTSCVNVQVPFGPVPRAEKALVAKPSSPYSAFATGTADQAWFSEKTNNTISYLSECKKSDEKVEDVALDAAKAIDQARILKSSSGLIDGKHTSELLVSGKVESKKIKMAIAVFKDHDCMFSLTYGGLEEHFESELAQFEEFKKGFKVP